MRTVFTVNEIAERWGYAPETIRRMEMDGKLHRVANLPGVKFSVAEVYQLESIGKEAQPLTAWERRKLEDEIHDLKQENEALRVRLNSVVMAAQGITPTEAIKEA